MAKIRLNNIPTWQIDVAGVVVALLFATAAYCIQIGPELQRHADASNQAAELDAENAKRRQLESSLRAAGEQLKSIHQFIAEHKINLEPSTRLNEQLGALGDLASRYALQIDGIEPAAETPGPSYTTLPIRMFGHGRYRDVVSYLGAIRTRMPDKGITGWEMTGGASPNAPSVSFSVTLVWYAAPKAAMARN
jgi:Tfp pilus assembly protein PilO